ncbi:MAG TPA: T9SS type A sorting domain-containing protein [Ignavibacteriaceae bacterium]|nr:T9SS type A sorting domain-containing protein [Ignavibacteriaceae bacterium]
MKNLITILLLITISVFTFPQTELPTGTSTLFSGSGNCILCHNSNGSAMTWNGIDVSPISYWRSTMMGNASKDPLWRAMVAEEVSNFPQHQELIESTCLKCHSPMGYTQAIYNSQTGYSMAELKQDPLANDGVSCTACHQIKPDNFGTQQSYSGNYIIHADSLLYGPYEDSDTTLMWALVGYKSAFSPHVNQSEFCATCHTLFTPTMDAQGNIIGEFPEQTPYIEWKNSIYPAQNIQCQDCHMPKIYDPIIISGMGNFPARTPFWRHTFVGGNFYMQNLLKNNIDSLGLTAEPEHFDSTIARTEYGLKEQSIELTTSASYQNDLLEVKLYIKNLTGHKIPTGIPFRRMWVHLKVEQGIGNVIFESGEWDGTGKIINYNSDYEPHYDLIDSEEQVQVYEGVFINNEQQVTYTLLRAAEYIKDNRLPPQGFSTSHLSYDTTKIVGNAVDDPNFNRIGMVQGTGGDSVTYLIPALPNAEYRITAEVCYQTIKTELVDHIRPINNGDINRFVNMYDALPNIPFIMKQEVLDIVTGVEDDKSIVNEFNLEQNYPNPFNPSTKIKYTIPSVFASETKQSQLVTLIVYDVLGNEISTLVNEEQSAGSYEVEFSADGLTSGIYFYKLTSGNPSTGSGQVFTETKKMLLMK